MLRTTYGFSICKKKSTSFEEFNKDSCYLTECVKNNIYNLNDVEGISYSRKVFTKFSGHFYNKYSLCYMF